MIMDTVFDSLCRCFGTNGVTSPGVGATAMPRSSAAAAAAGEDDPISGTTSTTPRPESTSKRRANNANQLLKNEEFDVLFEQNKRAEAQALQKAKMAATTNGGTSNNNRRPPKRKATLEGRRDAIFRLHRKVPTHADGAGAGGAAKNKTRGDPGDATSGTNSSATPTLVSRFLSSNPNVANALCFATPIRESQDAVDDNDLMASNDDDEHTAHTLNTNGEDTISSTIYFDRKLAHMTESRPPMPLFGEFKVQGGDDDELRRIVATDSHNSLKMISLMEDLQQQSQHTLPLEESEEEEMLKKHKQQQQRKGRGAGYTTGNDPPPPAQMLSDSMSSNSSSQSANKTPKKKSKSPANRGRTAVRRRRSGRTQQQQVPV
eukprot:CAMPEP_0194029130 /NCGR_PEP_ID=MMETSP0009_2-20130614/2963_1 /TAXON_ID=210454 /ORGANISM="Grammatophora oceanica, Strain CCMP 410" /LENGTH=374 /DNA_ID=CAMNT_0038668727 /DNA_START=559 /DNA_END=1683 /DNA_ORIENTATION=+